MQKNVLLYSASKMGFAMILINGNTALTCFWSTKLKKANHFKKEFTENRTLVKLTKLGTIKVTEKFTDR